MSKPTRTRPLALGYVRVSTVEQAQEGVSLDAQEARLRLEAGRRGWDLQLMVDDGVSAKDLKRPQMQKALDQMGHGRADVLMAVRLDRISRDVHDFTGLLKLAGRQSWQLVCLDPDIDTSTPMGAAMVQMMAVFSELERRLIGQRTSEALQQLKAQGRVLGTHVQHSDETLMFILDARASGDSFRAIAQRLNDAGVPTSKGAAWHAATVKRAAESIRASGLLAASGRLAG